MSLKAFHIFFIIISVLFAVGFGMWLLAEQPILSASLNIFAALCSFTVGGALILYAVRFLRKFKNLHFM